MTATVSPSTIPVAGAAFVRPLTAGNGIRLYGSASGYVGLKPAAAAGSIDYTLPSTDGTDGQAMVTNGSGVLSFATVATNPAGSGTELQYRNGSAFGAAGVYWDAVNSRLGIGTASPASKFNLNNGASASALTAENAVNNFVFTASAVGQNRIYFENQGATSGQRVFALDNYGGVFRVSSYLDNAAGYVSQDMFCVKYNGNVGIGTASPGAKLQVDTVSAATNGVIVQLASGQTANALEVNSYGGSGGNLFKVGATGNVTVTAASGQILRLVAQSDSCTHGLYVRAGTTNGGVGSGIAVDAPDGSRIFETGVYSNKLNYDSGTTGWYCFHNGSLATYRGVLNFGATTSEIKTVTTYGLQIAASENIDLLPGGYAGGSSNRSVRILSQNATDKPLILKGAAAQTANLQEWQDSAGTVLATVAASGAILSTVGISEGPVTFAVLNASTPAATLGTYRITDRGNRSAYPDGTNWRFVSDDAIIS